MGTDEKAQRATLKPKGWEGEGVRESKLKILPTAFLILGFQTSLCHLTAPPKFQFDHYS